LYEEKIMEQEFIEVRGARENNLKNVSLRIPKRKITVFTGVSGSGKSSLVFDTLGAEAQRQLNETFTSFVRNRLPKYGQPDADGIENLSTAVVVVQRRIGGNSRSTVGTITDIHPMLRLLFSRVGEPFVGYSNAFSFNDPEGMCPECSGVGKKVELDLERFFDTSRSLKDGAILHPEFKVGGYRWSLFAHSGLFDVEKRLRDHTDEEWEALLYGKPGKIEIRTPSYVVERDDFEGVVDTFNRLHINREAGAASERKRDTMRRFVSITRCPACGGARLNEAARSCRIKGYNIADFAAMEVRDLVEVVGEIKGPVAAPVVAGVVERLRNLVDIGLGYLSLERETSTLSGGESQRIKMVRHLSGSLVDLMFVFDEPTIGLHPRDVHRLTGLLRKLRDKGNTVLVVEHDPDVIEIADHVVDLGPGAGNGGGEVVYEGSVEGLMEADTPTGRSMREVPPPKTEYREPAGWMPIGDATLHNLKGVSVGIPEGVLTAVTGVAGLGKSTLVGGVFLERYPEAVVIDQSAVGGSVRSNPATYTGIMDDIRHLFAREGGVSPSLFSFNSRGACPDCKGLGFISTDLAFLEPIKTTCEVCGGKRFKDEVLGYTLRGKSIADVLEMTVLDALDFFDEEEEVAGTLRAVRDVGLDYLTLGQPLSSLSGGESQRIKLASELHKKGSVYVLDEPTTGLHVSDVGRLLAIMDRMVDGGNTVIVVEHNLDVVANADWIVDLGPDGGEGGGEVVFEGTPRQLFSARGSLTGEYLRRWSERRSAAAA
jgi:excinuclease UvrABC ATPase subunit